MSQPLESTLDTSQLTKLYYTIGEVAEMFDVSTSLLRYWEGEFSSIRPMKNRKGDRRYTVPQIEEIKVIYNLVKARGYTLEGAQNALKQAKVRKKAKADLLKRLQKLRKDLVSLKEKNTNNNPV